MINLNLLRVFHQVVEQHGVSGAAEKLFISQPAVSNALKRLQNDIGEELFVKQGRLLELSACGRALYEITGRLCELEVEIENLIRQQNRPGQHTLHLGLVTIYERFHMGDILALLQRFDTGISVSVHSGNSQAVLKMLQERSIDMAITGEASHDERLLCTTYKRHAVHLVVPRGHPLYGRASFSHEDLQQARMVLKEPGSAVRRVVDEYLKTTGVVPAILAELSNIDSIFDIITKEKCLSFLPDMSVTQYRQEGSAFGIVPCADAPLGFHTYIVTHDVGYYPSFMQPVIRHVHQNCACAEPH